MATIQELAQMSAQVYSSNAVTDIGSWKFLSSSPTNNNGYFGVAWQNSATGEIVIANRGTVPTNMQNLLSDLELTVHLNEPAQADAANFALDVYTIAHSKNPSVVPTIIETGHSLGGNEAQAGRTFISYLPLQLPTKKVAFLAMQIIFVAFLFLIETVGWYFNISILYILLIELTALVIAIAYLLIGFRYLVHRQYESALSLITLSAFLIFLFAVPSNIQIFILASKNEIHLAHAQDIDDYIKFSSHENEYLEAIKLTQPDSRGFRYKEFIWDFRFGGEGTRLVFDESDELRLPQDRRSQSWWKNVDEHSQEFFKDCLSGAYKIKSHFYVVRLNCG